MASKRSAAQDLALLKGARYYIFDSNQRPNWDEHGDLQFVYDLVTQVKMDEGLQNNVDQRF